MRLRRTADGILTACLGDGEAMAGTLDRNRRLEDTLVGHKANDAGMAWAAIAPGEVR